MNGFISLNREIVRWEWYSDSNTRSVFMHLLLVANWRDGTWKGIEIKRGQCIRSRAGLAKELGLSEQNIRTAIAHLKSTGELTTESTKHGTLLTIENYDFFIVSDEKDNQQTSQRCNHQVTSDQPGIKKNNNIKIKITGDQVNEFFETVWKMYPVKMGKAAVKERKRRELYNIGLEHMRRAIDRYLADLKKDEWRKPQNGSTFFNSGYVDYLDENYCQPEAKKEIEGLKLFDRREMER